MEQTAFAIIEFLYEQKKPVSKYHIFSRAEIPTQRPDRLTTILDVLLKMGWVSVIETTHSSYFEISGKGRTHFDRWGKDFLQFTREVRKTTK
jgi:DNA-binding PadR family transcriptional regulator